MNKVWRGWESTRPPDNSDGHNFRDLYFVLNATTEDIIREVSNNAVLAPFTSFAKSTAAAWSELNSLPFKLSSLRDSGNLVDRYKLLIEVAVKAIEAGDTSVALALGKEMDNLLNQLKRELQC